MIVLLLLGAFVSVGLSDVVVEKYGAKYTMDLPTDTYSIEYEHFERLRPKVLWKRDDPSYSSQDTRLKVTRSSFIIRHVTQRDGGYYVMKNRYNYELKRSTLTVRENKESYELVSGEQLRFSFDLKPNVCNVYFIPKTKFVDSGFETVIVRQGKLQTGLEKLNCSAFELLRPCGILIRDPQMSCNGHFEIRDDDDNKALVVELWKMETRKDSLYTVIGVTVGIFALIGCCCCCCCCVKCCKCLGSSDKNVSEAAVALQEYNCEPSQPLMPSYQVPAYTHSAPLIHNPRTVNPAKAEVPAPADDATVLSLSDNEPRFELKGMRFPLSLPLSSDAVYQDVYTSDKLNFK